MAPPLPIRLPLPVQVMVPALFSVRPFRNLLSPPLRSTVAVPAMTVVPPPFIEPPVQLSVPVTVKLPLPVKEPGDSRLALAVVAAPLKLTPLLAKFNSAVDVTVPSKLTAAPAKDTVPAPVNFVPSSRLLVPPGKPRVAPAATVKVPVLVPPLSASVAADTSTVPALLKASSMLVTAMPADFLKVPRLLNVSPPEVE